MIRSMEEFASAFHAARCVSTPLVAVRTADPEHSVAEKAAAIITDPFLIVAAAECFRRLGAKRVTVADASLQIAVSTNNQDPEPRVS
jgi:hypothetical protein